MGTIGWLRGDQIAESISLLNAIIPAEASGPPLQRIEIFVEVIGEGWERAVVAEVEEGDEGAEGAWGFAGEGFKCGMRNADCGIIGARFGRVRCGVRSADCGIWIHWSGIGCGESAFAGQLRRDKGWEAADVASREDIWVRHGVPFFFELNFEFEAGGEFGISPLKLHLFGDVPRFPAEGISGRRSWNRRHGGVWGANGLDGPFFDGYRPSVLVSQGVQPIRPHRAGYTIGDGEFASGPHDEVRDLFGVQVQFPSGVAHVGFELEKRPAIPGGIPLVRD